MGGTAQIVARGGVTDDELRKLNAFLRERAGQHVADLWEGSQFAYRDSMRDEDGVERHWVEVYTLEGYYAEGYERGNWPLMFATLMAVREHLPNADICYGSESDDPWDVPMFTSSVAADLWSHWYSDEGNAYSKKMRKLAKQPA